jgi:quinohemoprotein ethanol dehydrogenase
VSTSRYLWATGLLLALSACNRGADVEQARSAPAASVDDARLLAADQDTANWISYGRTYDEQRFSPLARINADNVSGLKLAWYYDLDTQHRGQEATPLVIDGVMYVTSAWSKVFALDAKSGKELWRYDPRPGGQIAIDVCCDVVNRGVAAWKGKIYVGTLDGRLVALDAATGKPVWEVKTTEPGSRYTITQAPRVVKGKVLIGNSGAEMDVRGYISAYDAETGKMVWRFYTVPGDPSKPFENPIHEKTVKTWSGEWWKLGGGGTVWDAMSYDPKLDLLYIGTGNGVPWSRKVRSPEGGDNLFLASIVALRPDTGEYVWHYQTTPGDVWDFDATQHLMLADLPINGQTRQVLMQANKNGFFYVLDRATGELISANTFVPINWATGIDMKTGRPIEHPDARFDETGKPWVNVPGPQGAHSWQPMSYSPQTGLVYIPASESGFPFVAEPDYKQSKLAFNIAVDLGAASLPQDPAVKKEMSAGLRGHLAAWDPVEQKEKWRVQYEQPWFGGVLATAGNLVFQGTATGEFVAYRADTGEKLWSSPTQAGVVAPPISYEVDGEQYVAVEVGWGGAFALAGGELALVEHTPLNRPRVLVFSLNGSATLPEAPPAITRTLQTPPQTADAKTVEQGMALFHRYCVNCHGDAGVSGGILPDLRYSNALSDPGLFQKIVHDGLLKETGMVGFGSELSKEQIEAVRAYVVHRAHETLAQQSKNE